MRVAVYYAPEPSDPLWSAGSAWLGRDAETAARVPAPPIDGLAALTADPARYGFHATLKPPMRLATSYDRFCTDVAGLAATQTPFALPRLAVTDLRGFLALRETEACDALQALADACVGGLDEHRAPPSDSELARRRAGSLSPDQEAMLARWGYPHVFGTWFFHMTLTARQEAPTMERLFPLATRHFAAALAAPRRVDALSVFTQIADGAPFLVAERFPFGG